MNSGAGGNRWRKLLPWLLVVAVALVYGRTLLYDFVNYDDYDLIVGNTEFLRDPGNILTSFTTHAFSTHREEGVYYRPVLLMTYFLDYHLWGLDPGGYHFTNLLLHALCAVFLFFLIREMAPCGPVAAFIGSLFFALHPVQTEAVAWVAGRNDLLLGLFVVLFLYFYVRSSARRESGGQGSAGSGGRLFFPAAVFFYGLALLTKEPAVFFVLLAPLYELTVARKAAGSLFSRGISGKMIVLGSVTLAYLAVRYMVFGSFIGSEELYGLIPPGNRFLMAPGLLTTNLLFVLWPFSQNVTHPIENVVWFEGPYLFAAIAFTAALIAAAFMSFRRSPSLSWTTLWILVGMVPLLNILPLAVPILEHRLYTTVAGAGAALAILIGMASRSARASKAAVPVTVALCVLLGALSFVRLPVWKNSETLWRSAIAGAPGAARPYFNLAGFYYERRQYDSTVILLEKYTELRPEDVLGYSKLRQTYLLTGRVPEAALVCRRLIDLNPKNVNRYLEAGLLYERVGLSDSVISIYEEGIGTDPGFYQLHQRLGTWYAGLGNHGKSRWYYDRAIETLENLGRRSPLSNDQLTLLTRLYAATGREGKIDSLSHSGGAAR